MMVTTFNLIHEIVLRCDPCCIFGLPCCG